MNSLFDSNAFAEIERRIENLRTDTPSQWGKMNPAQMTAHCQKPLEMLLGKDTFGLKPNFLIKLLFKKMMYNDKLWKKNVPTMKFFKVVDDRNFNTEVTKLKSLLQEVDNHHKNDGTWSAHPVFGEMTNEQWGKMQYKHLDHHLRQFGL